MKILNNWPYENFSISHKNPKNLINERNHCSITILTTLIMKVMSGFYVLIIFKKNSDRVSLGGRNNNVNVQCETIEKPQN
jgi:hypothetical protein